MSVSYAFSLPFFFYFFVLVYSGLFLFFKLPICFLMRKKGCGFGQMVKDLGGVGG